MGLARKHSQWVHQITKGLTLAKTPSNLKSTKGDVDRAAENGTTVKEEVHKRVLLEGLRILFTKVDFDAPVYNMVLLKSLHKQHLGFDPTEEEAEDKE
jgi:hypothetical protein